MQESFLIFVTKISLYPTIIFTGLMIFVTLYWLISILGMADMDAVDVGDAGADVSNDNADLSSAGFVSGLLLKFGLYGVPLIIILTLISVIGWVLSYIYTSFLHQWLEPGILYYVLGTGALVLVLVISMWLTGIIVSPIREKFAKIPKRIAANNIGKIAIVRTLSVTDTHGEAELSDGGAGLILRIRPDINSSEPPLKQGDRVVLVEYLNEANTYRVAPVKDE